MKDVYFVEGSFVWNAFLIDIPILQSDNVCWATIVNGQLVVGAAIPRPTWPRTPGFGSTWTEDQLRSIERFRVTRGGARLHAAESEQGAERLFVEPVLTSLRAEDLEQDLDLPVHVRRVQRHERVRRAEIAVPLRDLVLENRVVPKSVPGELADQSVVLVQVAPVVREDQVRPRLALQLLEDGLQLRARVGKETVAKFLEPDLRRR